MEQSQSIQSEDKRCAGNLLGDQIFTAAMKLPPNVPTQKYLKLSDFFPTFLYMSSQKVSSGKTSQSRSCVPLLPNGLEHPLDTDQEAQRGAGPHNSAPNLSPKDRGISQS